MTNGHISDNQIVEYYKSCGSYHQTATYLELSVDRVMKALSSAGIAVNETHAKVLDLYSQGISSQEIAEQLSMTLPSVMRYLPRVRPEYNSDEASTNALRIRKSRSKS